MERRSACSKYAIVLQVKALYDSLHEMKSRAEQAEMILTQVLADPSKLEFSIARIEGPSETYTKLLSLVESVDELEKEIITGEYDYFRIVADLLVEVQQKIVPFEAYVATPQITTVSFSLQRLPVDALKIVWFAGKDEDFGYGN